MKTPLTYQMTRYDCGPATLTNALRYLLAREESDPELLKAFYERTLDDYGDDGSLGKKGTSHQAMRNVAAFVNAYAAAHRTPLRASVAHGAAASLLPGSDVYRLLEDAPEGGAAVVARIWHGDSGHYVLLTGVADGRILAFDPWLEASDDPKKVADGTLIREVDDQPLRANRSVDPAVFNQDVMANYALKSSANADPDDPEGGELVILERTDR